MIRQRASPAIERRVSGAYCAITPSASWAAATTSSSVRHCAIASSTPASPHRRRSASLCGKLVSRMTTLGRTLALDAADDDALEVAEDRDHAKRRGGQRHHDPGVEPEPAGAVDPRRVVDLERDRHHVLPDQGHLLGQEDRRAADSVAADVEVEGSKAGA